MRTRSGYRQALLGATLLLGCGGSDDGGLREAPEQTEWSTSIGTVHLACEGRGTAPVVFLAGGADETATWSALVERLGPETLVCLFDRPGVGRSDRLSEPSTPVAVADVLSEVLEQASMAEGAVLVGHSLGGLTARVYGESRAASLTGAVLLDPTVPDPEDTILAEELEDLGWNVPDTIAQGQAVTSWAADVPVTVLSHDPALAIEMGTWSEADQTRWSAGQAAYGMLTPSATQRDVSGATHYVYRTNPDEVVDAIVALLP